MFFTKAVTNVNITHIGLYAGSGEAPFKAHFLCTWSHLKAVDSTNKPNQSGAVDHTKLTLITPSTYHLNLLANLVAGIDNFS